MNIIKSVLMSIAVSFFYAVSKGIVVWFCFPYIHYLFPTAIENGILPPSLNLWVCICVTWMIITLIKVDHIKIENKFVVEKDEN